jgi:hypothetical protein
VINVRPAFVMAIRGEYLAGNKHFCREKAIEKAMEEFRDIPQSLGAIRILAMAMANVCGTVLRELGDLPENEAEDVCGSAQRGRVRRLG